MGKGVTQQFYKHYWSETPGKKLRQNSAQFCVLVSGQWQPVIHRNILLHWEKIFVFYENKLCDFIQKQTFQHSLALLRGMMHSSGTKPNPHTPSSPLKLFLPLNTSVFWLYLGTTCTFLNKSETLLQKRHTKLSLTKQTFHYFSLKCHRSTKEPTM